MAYNGNGYIAADVPLIDRTKREQMDYFDSLSPEIRAILRDTHHNVSIKRGSERLFKQSWLLEETLRRIAKESAQKTYGSNYPLDTVK